jgi:SPP1 family phage portal protein
LGAFEIVLPLLDAINNVDSNRLDGVEQFVQALMLFHNVDISAPDYEQLRQEGAIKFKDIDPQFKAEIKYLVEELNQSQTQTLIDHLYNTVLTICGMPNRNGGSSTSDTGSAVIMRDGWSAAEARAKDSELMFKKSEKEFLKLLLRICRDLADLELKLSSIEIRFTRRNYENITEKANVLVAMLNNAKIAPQLAFSHCGMFVDPEMAFKMSEKYIQDQEAKAATVTTQKEDGNGDGNNPDSDPGSGTDDQ